jgi:hypothetical protein
MHPPPGVPFVFPLQELTAFRLADRGGDVIGADESLVAEDPAGVLQDLLGI